MYHIVKDVASLITMSSENHSLTALFLRIPHFQTRRLDTPKRVQLTCFTSYSWDVPGWCSDKKGEIFLSVDPFKEKNK